MRLIIQRVTDAKVEVEGKVVSEIGRGLFVLVGITTGDTPADAEYLYVPFIPSICSISTRPHHLTADAKFEGRKSCLEFAFGIPKTVRLGRRVLWNLVMKSSLVCNILMNIGFGILFISLISLLTPSCVLVPK